VSLPLLACCAFLAAGCRLKNTTSRSKLNMTSLGRDIHVSADSGAGVQADNDQLRVKLPGHEIVIGKERLLLDQEESAKASAEAKKFEVIFEGGTLTAMADAVGILKTPLRYEAARPACFPISMDQRPATITANAGTKSRPSTAHS
jgi:hypothetical protein